MRPDTRHLDTAIAILGGGRTKRKPSGPVIHIVQTGQDSFNLQFNRKVVLFDIGLKEEAWAEANRRADVMLRLKGVRPTIKEELL